jgi:hypothetical protein
MMSNEETASANNMNEIIGLMEQENDDIKRRGTIHSGGGGAKDKIEIKIEEDED